MKLEEKFRYFTNKYRAGKSKAALLDIPTDTPNFIQCKEITGFWEWHSEKGDIDIVVHFQKTKARVKTYWYCPQTHNDFQYDSRLNELDSASVFETIFAAVQRNIQWAKSRNRCWINAYTEKQWEDAATGLSIRLVIYNKPMSQSYAAVCLNNGGYLFEFKIYKHADSVDFEAEAQEFALKSVRERAAQIAQVFSEP